MYVISTGTQPGQCAGASPERSGARGENWRYSTKYAVTNGLSLTGMPETLRGWPLLLARAINAHVNL
jgi:hypothetical protein